MGEDNIPKESETIAAKKAVRSFKKARLRRANKVIKKAWWSSVFVEFWALAIIFALNFYLYLPFFGTSMPDSFYSGPIVPFFAHLIGLAGTPFNYALQIVNIFFFILLPFSLYIFVMKLTDRKIVALLAALVVSLPIYPFAQARINASLLGRDSAHIASLSILPFALYGLFSFMRKGKVGNLVVASLASALIALISPFGFLTFLIFASISVFSEILLGQGRLKLIRFLIVLFFAGGLNSFWYHPGLFMWMAGGSMGEEIRLTISKLVPISFFALPALGTFGYLLFDRKPNLQSVFLASFFTISFFMVSSVGGGFFPSHSSRYVYELGISIAFLFGVFAVKLVDYFRFSERSAKGFNKTLFANGLLFGICFYLAVLIVLGRGKVTGRDDRVLGIWQEVEKGDIWSARDRFAGVSSMLGYLISAASAVSLSVIGFKGGGGKLANKFR